MIKRHDHNYADEAGSSQQMNNRIEENTKALEEVRNTLAVLSLQLTQIVNNQTNTRNYQRLSEIYVENGNHRKLLQQKLKEQAMLAISEPISGLANFMSDLSKPTSQQICSIVSDIRGEMGLGCSSRFFRT
ncbi:hypothetical protein Hanom_Chr02g00133311 [Helianthus anomalus]